MSEESKSRGASQPSPAVEADSFYLFQRFPAAMWILDSKSMTFRDANEAALRLYGYTRQQFLGMSIFKISQPEQASLLLESRQGGIAEHRHASGRSLTVEVNTRDGRIGGRDVLLGVSREISDKVARHRMVEQNRETERLIRAFLDAEPQFVQQLNRDGKVLNINQAGLRLIGCTYDQVLAKKFDRFVLPKHRDSFSSLLTRVFAGESVKLQFQISSASPRLLDMNAVPIRNALGSVTSMLAISRDITERRRAQDRLIESERRFATVFAEAPLGMCLVDRSGHYLQVNRTYAKLLGYSDDELVGKHFLELTHLKDREASAETLARFLSGEVNVFEIEKCYIHKQGHEVIVTAKGCAIRNSLGELEYILALVQDQTEWKRAEKALRDQKMMSTLGALVASVAHEVRNPLFGISAVLDAFEARYSDDTTLRRYFEAMRSELGRMNDLMRELLDYGKPVTLELESVSVTDVLREALMACLPLAKQRGVNVRTDLRDSPLSSEFDRRRLYLAFRNLADNAIHYSPAGTTVLIEVANVRDHDGSWVAFNFRDSGPGFSSDDIPRIFEPFFSRRKGGTGLGLAIVKRIVEEHGGTVSASNRDDGGAVVTLKLPQKTSSTEAPRPSAAAGQ